MSNVPDSMAILEILRAACCIAAQDGCISVDERPIIERLAKKAGVGAASLNAMIEQAEADPDFNREQFKIIRTDPVPTLRALAAVAVADGAASGAQQQILASFATRLGVGRERLGSILKDEGA